MSKFFLIPVAFLFFGAITFLTYTFLNCTDVSGSVSSSVNFSLVSEPETVTAGETFKVRVYFRSDNHKSNVFSPQLTFPQDLLEVKAIETKEFPTVSKNWLQNRFNNELGTISLTAGVVNPGLSTLVTEKDAYLATIIFVAKKAGAAVVSYADNSAIYSNVTNENILEFGEGVEIVINDSPKGGQIASSLPTSLKKTVKKRVNFQHIASPKPVAKKSC